MKLELGKLGSESDILGQKDAFHAPCIMVQSHEKLKPGQYIRFTEKLNKVISCDTQPYSDGIVDPFLEFMIPPNTKFWMLLNPEIISNLTHNFQIKSSPLIINDNDGCKAMRCN